MRFWYWCAVAVFGCTPSAFGPAGYVHPEGQYKVAGTSGNLLGNDWILDSHYGSLDSSSPKSGPDYELMYEFDTDDDGDIDRESALPLYDMRWEHAVDSAVIWTRTIPVPQKFARKDPKVLLMNYIERIAGSGLALVTYGSKTVAVSTRYGTKVLSTAPTTVGKQTAFTAEIEIVNLDQHELDSESPRHMAKLVLLHTPTPLNVRRSGEHPALLLAVYSSRPSDYAAHVGEFEEFVERIDLGAGTSPFRSSTQQPSRAEPQPDPQETLSPPAIENGDPAEPAPPASDSVEDASSDGTVAPPDDTNGVVRH